ncbi:hypothetical protein ACHAPJ_005146 [Fusarium lateritium]
MPTEQCKHIEELKPGAEFRFRSEPSSVEAETEQLHSPSSDFVNAPPVSKNTESRRGLDLQNIMHFHLSLHHKPPELDGPLARPSSPFATPEADDSEIHRGSNRKTRTFGDAGFHYMTPRTGHCYNVYVP